MGLTFLVFITGLLSVLALKVSSINYAVTMIAFAVVPLLVLIVLFSLFQIFLKNLKKNQGFN
jgi:prepilin signal peptidase PulO-like enzyme (type II secretory pathway)